MSLYCISKDDIEELCNALFPNVTDHSFFENMIKLTSKGVITTEEYEFVTHKHKHWTLFNENGWDKLDRTMGWCGYEWDEAIDESAIQKYCSECEKEESLQSSVEELTLKRCQICDLPVCEYTDHQVFEGDWSFSEEWNCPETNHAKKTATCPKCKDPVYYRGFHERSDHNDGRNKKYMCY